MGRVKIAWALAAVLGRARCVEAMAAVFKLGPCRHKTARSPNLPVALATEMASGQCRQPVFSSPDGD